MGIFKYEFEDELRCKISGFTGKVVARDEWMNGCIRYALQSKMKKGDKKPETLQWIDEAQIELVKAKKKVVKKYSSGGERPSSDLTFPGK